VRVKWYPLEIENVYEMDNGGLHGWRSKGHHEPTAFLAALDSADDVALEVLKERHPGADLASRVTQTWRRNVPAPYDRSVGHVYHQAAANSPGAYPTTEIER
jgi:hypothetical protein